VSAQERLVKGHFNLRNWAVIGEIGCAWLMSAFPESGHPGTAKTAEIRVRFRPNAVVESGVDIPVQSQRVFSLAIVNVFE